ncbi:C-terminal binding protein [Haloarchaeobius sp. HRN-SO-5]|uniref:C-terminal binding protein n=1 Tax=Haloarchaeobius sp. HRN-SO-5 TaxID=3446118 RepID=UPI003EBABB81
MADSTGERTVAVTAGSAFDLEIERAVFEGMDVRLQPVDVESTDDLIAELANVDAVIDRLLAAPYTTDVIDALGQCAVIARCGIGIDGIDVERATERGILVSNVPVYCQDEVSEHAILLLLALERTLVEYDAALKDGTWAQELPTQEIHRLRGQTMGLVAFGTIARLVAEKARAFGMNVIASDPYVDAGEMAEEGVEKIDFEELLRVADVVSLHAPLNEETKGIIDIDAFERMKDSAVLINVARGGLVVEDDLVTALRQDEIGGAGLDVFEEEPANQRGEFTPFKSPLQELENVVLTPHIAWFSREADEDRRRTAAHDVRHVLEGGVPENVVNDPY